ncbi:MAG: pentapeptide repeat-containing protein [Paludibacter sp.]|nr:pentapeptide repeat-containing protein [Paludibacter sp.]
MKTDGFPANKEAGIPCKNLMSDFCCTIHSNLVSKNMRGCLAYDCFGAGQKVTQVCYPNGDWKTNPGQANEIFDVFLIVFQLHQMLWYLVEALSLISDEPLKSDIDALISENQQMTNLIPDEILNLDIEKYRLQVNQALKRVSGMISSDSSDGKQIYDYFGTNFKKANLDGRDFSMSLMIAANLEGCSLQGTNFLGADMRDTNIKNTDLSGCVFLTQMQINSAKGNSNTKIPVKLSRPNSWQGL